MDSHYKFEKVDNMASLLDVIDKEKMASFLHDDATKKIIVVCTTHMIKDDPIVWIGLDWESFLQVMKHAKVSFKVVVCICDQDSFKNMFSMVMKSSHVMSFQFEFGQYMVKLAKVPGLSKRLMTNLVILYAYLFPCKIGTNIKEDVFGNNELPSLEEHNTSSFPKDKRLYKNEIYLEAQVKILKLIIYDGMVCLSVFSRGVLTYIYLVSHILHIFLKYS